MRCRQRLPLTASYYRHVSSVLCLCASETDSDVESHRCGEHDSWLFPASSGYSASAYVSKSPSPPTFTHLSCSMVSTPTGKAAGPDFKKKKNKVGKKSVAVNATNTSFRAQALRLPAAHTDAGDDDAADDVRNERGHSLQVRTFNGMDSRRRANGMVSCKKTRP